MYLMTDCTKHSRYWALTDSCATPFDTFAELSSEEELNDIPTLTYVAYFAWILAAAGQEPPAGAEDRSPWARKMPTVVATSLPSFIHKYAMEVSLGVAGWSQHLMAIVLSTLGTQNIGRCLLRLQPSVQLAPDWARDTAWL